MRIISALLVGLLPLALSGDTSRADYILNCQLMDKNHPQYEGYCQGQVSGFLSRLVDECPPDVTCTVRLQNLKGSYSTDGDTLEKTAATVKSIAPGETSETGLTVASPEAEQTAPSAN